MDAEIKALLKLIRAKDKIVRNVRSSTLAKSRWCDVQAYLTAIHSKYVDGEWTMDLEVPRPPWLDEGTSLHTQIRHARKESPWETEFYGRLADFADDVQNEEYGLSRVWKHNQIHGKIRCHHDELKVHPDKRISLTEYKSRGRSVVQWVHLMPAIFQIQIGVWILHPIAAFLGYDVYEAQVVFVSRKSRKPLGFHEIDLNYRHIEEEIDGTFVRFNNPAMLIPPRRYKCFMCAEVFKSRCPFQGHELDVENS